MILRNGSSPRVWGKVDSSRGKSCIVPVTDHPHGCGEKRLALMDLVISSYSIRIIPTGVGKSNIWNALTQFVGVVDHPHGCGEKL